MTIFFIIISSNAITILCFKPLTRNILSKIRQGESYVLTHEDILGVDTTIKLMMSFSALICVALMIFIAIRFVKPIIKLTAATNDISAGNYDVYIDSCNRDDEIGRLIKHFNAMANELKNKEYLQVDFTNNVSHEFRTPLTSIQGYAKILSNDSLSREERKEYLDIIIEESKRLENLSHNILTLSKLENQEKFETQYKFKLDEQIRKSILLLENFWQTKNISFELDLPDTYYYGAEEFFLQVWINIIHNAIKFSNDRGIISIKIEKTPNEVIVTIKDNGFGMNDDVKQHLWDKFYQGDRSRIQQGFGLGMSIVKRIVDLSGGKTEVESELGRGSSFILKLPF